MNYCLALPDSVLEYPFDEKTPVIRHTSNKKIFAIFTSHSKKSSINLKCDPSKADFLRNIYSGVTPGYHMNKVHWNTVYLESDVPENEIMEMIDDSYKLIEPKRKK